MKPFLLRYLTGILFLAIGIYEFISVRNIPDGILCVCLSFAFLIMGFQAQFPEHHTKKTLTIASWIFILGAALTFLYVLTIPDSIAF